MISISSFLNPFSFLIEIKEFMFSRILRTTFWEKLKDAFFTIFGVISLREDPRLGVVDYLTFGLSLLVRQALFYAEARNFKEPSFLSRFAFILAMALSLVIIGLPSIILTFISIPLIGIIHLISQVFYRKLIALAFEKNPMAPERVCGLVRMSETPIIENFVGVMKNQYIIADEALWYFDHRKMDLKKLEFLDGKSLSALVVELGSRANRYATEQELSLITSYTGHTPERSEEPPADVLSFTPPPMVSLETIQDILQSPNYHGFKLILHWKNLNSGDKATETCLEDFRLILDFTDNFESTNEYICKVKSLEYHDLRVLLSLMKLNIGSISSRLEKDGKLSNVIKSIRSCMELSQLAGHSDNNIVSNVVLPHPIMSLAVGYLGDSNQFVQRYDSPLWRRENKQTPAIEIGSPRSP